MLSTYPYLHGKVVVVTGGSRGIGAHTAEAFAAQGSRVCVVGRDRAALDAVAAKITAAGGTALPAVADVTDPDSLQAVRERVTAELGPVDVLAAFAGGEGYPVPLERLTPDQWRRTLDVNLTAVFLSVQTFVPEMLERGRGSILTMSSTSGRQPSQANLAYGAAKAGLIMLTRQLATELGPRGVRVNAIAPSTILTEKVSANMPEQVQQQVAAMHPQRRLGTVEDVAQTALFLASDAASWLTGLTVDVSGGRVTN